MINRLESSWNQLPKKMIIEYHPKSINCITREAIGKLNEHASDLIIEGWL